MDINAKEEKLYFNGMGEVKNFVEKVELIAELKGHENDKKARFIANKLSGSTFEVYRRLSANDKIDPEKIKTELLKEYSREERNREEALHKLMRCVRLPNESPQRLAYRLLYLIGLAYGTLNDASKNTIAKDFFVKALSTDLQVALKSIASYKAASLCQLSDKTTRLEFD